MAKEVTPLKSVPKNAAPPTVPLAAQVEQLLEIVSAVIDVVGAQQVIARIEARKAEREAAAAPAPVEAEQPAAEESA